MQKYEKEQWDDECCVCDEPQSKILEQEPFKFLLFESSCFESESQVKEPPENLAEVDLGAPEESKQGWSWLFHKLKSDSELP